MLSLETPVNDTFRRDVDLADSTLLDPTQSDALEQGEWLTRNTSGTWARVGASSVTLAHQIFTERGDYGAQALGKCTVLQLHDYIGETDMFEDAGGGFSEGDYLTVKAITVAGVARSGLTQAVQGTDHAYAIVTKNPANNNGKLGFQKIAPYEWST